MAASTGATAGPEPPSARGGSAIVRLITVSAVNHWFPLDGGQQIEVIHICRFVEAIHPRSNQPEQ